MNVSVTLPMIREQVIHDIYVNPPPPRTEEDLQVCVSDFLVYRSSENCVFCVCM